MGSAPQVHINSQHLLTMTSLNSKLQLALLNRKKGRNLIEKGFTLVELMIVIVIVGILSAVALPNFLSQTDKAKATEAKSVSSAYLKQIYAAYQEGGLSAAGAAIGTGSIPCPAETRYFTFNCPNPENAQTNQIVATGNSTSGSLLGSTITSSVYLTAQAAVAEVPSSTDPVTGAVTPGQPAIPALSSGTIVI